MVTSIRSQVVMLTAALRRLDFVEFDAWGRTLARRLAEGQRVLLAGNGGSAAQVQHVAAELTGRFVGDREPLSALALTADSAGVTAISNDYGFDRVFARQVQAHGRPGDVLLLLSTSGSSPNVLAAADEGRRRGLTVWALTGRGPNPLADRSDRAICVDAPSTATVQECHLVGLHAMCSALDEQLRPGDAATPGGDALIPWSAARSLSEAVRARGGTVAAAGGCFDLLHAGHVALLEQARRFGDCLVVCLNSDASVARLKGPDRPIVPAAEREAMLRALACVDEVAIFDEDTPDGVLRALRPEIWVKGGDYTDVVLPEAAVLRTWGGRVVLADYIDGRSTTALIAQARALTGSR